MATKLNRTTSTKTTRATKVAEPKVDVEEAVEDAVSSTPEKSVSKTTRGVTRKKSKYADNDVIVCRSCTAGELLFVGKKTGNLYAFSNYGDRCEIEFADLRAAKLTHSAFVYKPLFIIEDDELLDDWTDVYETYAGMYTPADFKTFFNLPNDEFRAVLIEMPKGLQDCVKSVARERISTGRLDSLNKIKILDEVLDTDLMLFIED